MKIYVRLRGGLGNQMFQYAYALAIKTKYPRADLYLDIREYETYHLRNFELDQFVLSEHFLHSQGKLPYDMLSSLYRVYQRLYREVVGHGPSRISDFLAQKGFVLGGTYSPLPRMPLPDTVYLYGYFQSIEPIEPLRAQLTNVFSLPDIEAKKIIPYLAAIKSNSVAISIRLGKGMAESGWSVYDRSYYNKAISYIKEKFPLEQLVILSDRLDIVMDEQWFDQTIYDILYVRNCTPCQQIEIMKRCRHFIISNSTFAWWGAYLGAYGKESMIIAPKIWQENVLMANTPLFFNGMVILE